MSAYQPIDDPTELRALARDVSGSAVVAIDTEFVRESTYYPKLCLIQIATDELAACVDCLAGLDLAPLVEALCRPDCTWLLHSGRQDLEVLALAARCRPAALIDTQIAAALTGYAAQIGLQEILADALAVDIGKAFTRTDWSRRPLPEGAVRYALDDVRYLLPLWRELARTLDDLGRREWLAEDGRRLLAEADADGLAGVFGRVKGVQGLHAEGRAAALALVEWRERTAQRLDRPRRWIMSDELLLRIAERRPVAADELAAVPEMPKRLAARAGNDILAAVAARHDARFAAVLAAVAGTERPDKEALKTLQQHVKERAATLGIQPEVLASRRDLIAWLTGSPPAHLSSGWRAAEIGTPGGPAAESPR